MCNINIVTMEWLIVVFDFQTYRNKKWRTVPTDELLPGDVVSIGKTLYYNTLTSH